MPLRLPLLVAIIFATMTTATVADDAFGLRGVEKRNTRQSTRTEAGRTEQRGFVEVTTASPQESKSNPRDSDQSENRTTDPVSSVGATPVNYMVFDQTLDTVITELGKLGGYTVALSRDVGGKVSPGRLEGNVDQVLEKLKRGNSLVTMRDGNRLVVATEAESVTRVMRTGGETPQRIREVLRNLVVDDLPKRISIDDKSGLIQISAPPVILERIEVILANAARPAAPAPAGLTVVRFGRKSVE